MNLREEIRQIIEYAQRDTVIYVDDIGRGKKEEEGAVLPNPFDISEQILKLIEKRIDSINDLDDEIKEGNYSGDEEFWDGYELGFDKAIELTKKEMLNKIMTTTNNNKFTNHKHNFVVNKLIPFGQRYCSICLLPYQIWKEGAK